MAPKPETVLFLENGIGWGGAAICLKLIAEYLDKSMYQPLITTPHRGENYDSYAEVAEWHFIPQRVFRKKVYRSRTANSFASLVDYIFNLLPYVFRLCKLAREKKVKIIHLNNEPICNMAGVIMARLLNIPCVSHVRGPVVWDSKITRWIYKQVDHFIAVSEWIKKDVMKTGVPEHKIQVIWDGRNLSEFMRDFDVEGVRKSLGLQNGELSVGMVGRLNPWKGHTVFLEAAKIVERKIPYCKLFIVGGSSETYRGYEIELKKLAHEKNIKNVVFTGQRNDIPDIMRTLDILVHASVEPDPYPNVVLEGMAAKRPVIATNLGGPLEMIENYKTGILIPPNDPEILADKICELISDKDLRRSLGEQAGKVAFERYAIENNVQQIEEIYERLSKR